MPGPTDQLPPDLREALLGEIDPGETLRWCDQPLPSRMARKAVVPAIAVFVMLGFFGTMGVIAGVQTWRELSDPSVRGATGHDAGLAGAVAFVALGGVVFLGALGALTSPLFARAKARRTVYALTDTRVFIMVRHASGRIHTDVVEPGHPLSISRREHPDGSGDIALYPMARAPRAHLLLGATPHPRTAERLIRNTFDPPGAR